MNNFPSLVPADVQAANQATSQTNTKYSTLFSNDATSASAVSGGALVREPTSYVTSALPTKLRSDDTLHITCGNTVPAPNLISQTSAFAFAHPSQMNNIYLLTEQQLETYHQIHYKIPTSTNGLLVLPYARSCVGKQFDLYISSQWQSSLTIYTGIDTSATPSSRSLDLGFVASISQMGSSHYVPEKFVMDRCDYFQLGPFSSQPDNELSNLSTDTYPRGVLSFRSAGHKWIVSGSTQLPCVNAENKITNTGMNIQVFSTPGAHTYVPTSGMKYCIVEVQGAGGGGGGIQMTNTNQSAAGGGGGAGGYCKSLLYATQIGTSQDVTVGAGGLGALGNVTGSSGGNSSFATASGQSFGLTANGGVGGFGFAGIANAIGTTGGGVGGAATGGNIINITGGCGTCAYTNAISGTVYWPGAGGHSFVGNGPQAITNVNNQPGSYNGQYGSGGTGSEGAGAVASDQGSNGGNGIVIITEYF